MISWWFFALWRKKIWHHQEQQKGQWVITTTRPIQYVAAFDAKYMWLSNTEKYSHKGSCWLVFTKGALSPSKLAQTAQSRMTQLFEELYNTELLTQNSINNCIMPCYGAYFSIPSDCFLVDGESTNKFKSSIMRRRFTWNLISTDLLISISLLKSSSNKLAHTHKANEWVLKYLFQRKHILLPHQVIVNIIDLQPLKPRKNMHGKANLMAIRFTFIASSPYPTLA